MSLARVQIPRPEGETETHVCTQGRHGSITLSSGSSGGLTLADKGSTPVREKSSFLLEIERFEREERGSELCHVGPLLFCTEYRLRANLDGFDQPIE